MKALRISCLLTTLTLALSTTLAAESRVPISGPVTISTSGTYVVTRDIASSGNGIEIMGATVTIDLNGHTVSAPNLYYAILVRSGAVVILKNGHLRGGLSTVYGYGVGSRIRISSLDIAGASGYGIQSSDIAELVVADSTIQSSQYGILAESTNGKTHVRITGNTIDAGVRAIDLNATATAAVSGGEIGHNTLQATTDAAVVIRGWFGGTTVHDNTVTTANGSALYVSGSGGNLVQSNVIENAAGNGIEVQSHGNRIVGNVVNSCGNNGITIPSTNYNLVDSNDVSRNGGYGIYLGGGANGWRNNLAKQNTAGDYFNAGGNMDGGGNL